MWADLDLIFKKTRPQTLHGNWGSSTLAKDSPRPESRLSSLVDDDKGGVAELMLAEVVLNDDDDDDELVAAVVVAVVVVDKFVTVVAVAVGGVDDEAVERIVDGDMLPLNDDLFHK